MPARAKKSKPPVSKEGRMPSQRQLRVSNEIKKVLAGIFMRGDFPTPFATPITVSQVKISPDFSVAWAFIMPLSGAKVAESLRFLNDNSWWFRKTMAKSLGLRITPDLKFSLDDSFDEAFKIEKILHTKKVRDDINKDS